MDATPDLTVCESEPLSRLGLVQPHGALLVLDPAVTRVVGASAGLGVLFGLEADPRPGDLAAPWLGAELLAALPHAGEMPAPLPGAPAGFECLAHRGADGIVIEWIGLTEAAPSGLGAVVAQVEAQLAADAGDIFRAAQALAEGAATIGGYDRVMVYRFHPDWSGEVIAERRRPELPPYLGLHYPASDIPSQARALYRRAPIRVVGDVQAVPLVLAHAGTVPPDLSLAVLRTVSRFHVQYLRNMGVRATLTVSLMHRGELWGMLACHHGTPRLPPAGLRAAMAGLAAPFAAMLDRMEEAARAASARAVTALRDAVLAGPPEERLSQLMLRIDGLATAAGADGVALVTPDHVISVGLAPDPPTLRDLAAAMPAGTGPVATAELRLPPAPERHRIQPAGMLAAALPAGGWLALFRREMRQEIHWAGDPAKPVEPGTLGDLSPRRSFALWREEVHGRCRPWAAEEEALLSAAVDLLVGAAPLPVLAATAAVAVAAFARGGPAVLHAPGELLAPHALGLILQGRGEAARLVGIAPAFATLLGLPANALRGQQWRDAAPAIGLTPLPAEDGAGPVPHAAYSPVHGPLLLRLSLEAALQLEAPGLSLCFDVLAVRDETRQGQLASALEATALQADRARRARAAFLRNVRHELRTPLNAIIGFGDLLADPALRLSQEEARDYAAEVAAAGRGLLQLVENLIAVADLDAGRLAPRRRAMDLAALLRDQVAALAPLFEAKPLRFTLQAPPAAPCISDPALVGLAVQNLLLNALKFTPPNGDVACRLALLPNGLEIRVVDTGPGIAPEDRTRIFEAFEQADESLSRRHGGAGIGLYLARGLVELLGGSLVLEAAEAGGSSFVARLPRGE